MLCLNANAIMDAYIKMPESYNALRINLDMAAAAAGRSVQTIALISARREEGRTTAAVHLALAYARAGCKTVLVDADMRSPGAHLSFGLDASPGLSEALVSDSVQNAGWVRQTSVARLSLLTAGPASSSAPELAASPSMELLISGLKEHYDKIIVDCPPLAFIEAKLLASQSDGAVLVIEYGKINRELALKIKDELAEANVRLLGTVLNKSRE